MNYLPRNKSRSKLWKPIIALTGVFIAGFLVLTFFSGAITSVAAPIWKTENLALAKVNWVANFFRTKTSLIRENQELKDKLSVLELEAASRSTEPLRSRQTENGILSTVLVRPPQTPYDMLVIDAGMNDGVATGMTVALPEGPVVGVVEIAYARESKVKLYSSQGVKTAAILERYNVPVTLEGIGGGNFKIVIPREAEAFFGDRILSAKLSSELLAVVGEVKMEATDSFKNILAQSPVNIFNLHFVVVK